MNRTLLLFMLATALSVARYAQSHPAATDTGDAAACRIEASGNTTADRSTEPSAPLFLPHAEVRPGRTIYKILGRDFRPGDRIVFAAAEGDAQELAAKTTATEEALHAVIPKRLRSGVYRLVLVRGGERQEIGTATFSCNKQAAEQPLPRVVAHRGFHTRNGATENSMASFGAALDLEVYGSEADFYITRDGVVISNHDPTINGIRLEEALFDDIRDIRLSNGELIATFAAYLDRLEGRSTRLIIEIKRHSTKERNDRVTDSIVDMVRERGMIDRVDFISFEYDICRRLAEQLPGTTVGYLSGNKSPEEVAADGINCIDYNIGALRKHPEWVAQAHERNMTVNVWTVNAPAEMMEMIALGVDFITTDRPDMLAEMLRLLAE